MKIWIHVTNVSPQEQYRGLKFIMRQYEKPKTKSPQELLKQAYSVTICTQDRKCFLWNVGDEIV